MLPMKINTKVPEILREYIQNLRHFVNNHKDYSKEQFQKIFTDVEKKIKDETGLVVKFGTRSGAVNASAGGNFLSFGHAATMPLEDINIRILINKHLAIADFTKLEIDLNKLKFKGPLAEKFTNVLIVYYDLFDPRLFTDDEILTILLHEFGHICSNFINVGDYFYTNQYIANAIEIFQGKSTINNKVVEVYSEEWLRTNLDKEELAGFIYGQASEADAVKVALIASRKIPRGHLSMSKFSSNVREEQFADLFVSRLGYGVQYAKTLYKLEKFYDRRPSNAERFAKTIKMLLKVPFRLALSPIYLTLALLEDTPEHLNHKYRYDEYLERITKIKRDLVAQLKIESDPVSRKQLAEDIKVVERTFEEFAGLDRTFVEALAYIVKGRYRKEYQQYQKEQILEALVNNDIFVLAERVS